MFTVFDLYSLILLSIAMGTFGWRYGRKNPAVYPYLIVVTTCLIANWLGEAGGGIFALALLVAASFSLLTCLLYPTKKGQPSEQDASVAPSPASQGTQTPA